MGNFNNVTMGNGVLSIGGVDVGYLKGNVKYTYNYDIEEFKTGVPLSLRGSITKEIIAELTAPIAEITAENIGNVLGGLTPAAVAAVEVDKTIAYESLTFSADPYSPGIQSVKMGPTANMPQNVTITPASVIVRDSTEAILYVEFTDYIVDYSTGRVWRNPNGTIVSLSSNKFKYKYTPPATKTLNLGATFALGEVAVQFVHTSPVTGKDIKVYMWKANASGNAEFEFAEDSWVIVEPTFKAVYDATHATNPLGYIEFEQ